MKASIVLVFSCGAALGYSLASSNDPQVQMAARAEQQLRAGEAPAAMLTLEGAAAEKSTPVGEDRIGFLYAAAGKPDDAVLHFRKALDQDAAYAAAHYHLGAVLWLQKDQDHGLPELQAAARLGPRIFDYRYRLGSAYVETGANQEAISELKAAVALNAASADAWQELGLAEQRQNDLAAAVAAYAKAVDLNPKNDVTRNSYSALLIETRQPERGISEANKVLAHNKADSSAEMNVGYAYLRMGEFGEAEKAYRSVVAMEPASAAAHYDLAIALKMQDQIEAAQQEFRRSIELEPSLVEAHYTLGITNWQLGDFPGTIEQMKAALAIRPDYAEAHYMLGIALKQTGDLDGALAELKESIRLDPTTPGPYNTLGQILRIKGDKKGSEEAFAAGAKLKSDKEGQLANTLQQGMRGNGMPKPLTPK